MSPFHRALFLLLASLLWLPLPGGAAEVLPPLLDLRGDEGLLLDLEPRGAVVLAPNRFLVPDARYNQLHIFDPEGRRFRRLDIPRNLPEAAFQSAAALDGSSFLVAGSFHHIKNNPRFVHPRSVIYRFTLHGETLSHDSARTNLAPLTGLARTGLYGQMVADPLELGGMAVDTEQKRLYLGLARPPGPDGTLRFYEARLTDLLESPDRTELTELPAALSPGVEPTLQTPFQLSAMSWVPGKGLIVLLSSQDAEGARFGSNQLWLLPEDASPARQLAIELAPGNRGAGLGLREEADGTYTAILLFDNRTAQTGIPPRMMLWPGLKL